MLLCLFSVKVFLLLTKLNKHCTTADTLYLTVWAALLLLEIAFLDCLCPPRGTVCRLVQFGLFNFALLSDVLQIRKETALAAPKRANKKAYNVFPYIPNRPSEDTINLCSIEFWEELMIGVAFHLSK